MLGFPLIGIQELSQRNEAIQHVMMHICHAMEERS